MITWRHCFRPVLTGRQRHAAVNRILVQLVQCGRGSGTPGADDSCRNFSLKRIVVEGAEKRPVHKGFHRAGYCGEMHWKTEDETVELSGLIQKSVDGILVVKTAFRLAAGSAAEAADHRPSSDPEHFRSDAVLIQRGSDFAQFGEVYQAVNGAIRMLTRNTLKKLCACHYL